MGWLLLLGIAAASLFLFWRFAEFRSAELQLVGAAVFVALAGYAWQGRPSLAGAPRGASAARPLSESSFAALRGEFFAQFDAAARWLTIAEHFQRTGKTRDAVAIIQAGLKGRPNDPDLWVGLGNALVLHAGGIMTPAAQLAYDRALEIAPKKSGIRYFYGLAQAETGRPDLALPIWQALLADAPADAPWRNIVAGSIRIAEVSTLDPKSRPQ